MKLSRPLILDGFFLLLLVALTIAFFQVLRPFFLDLFLAVILTTLTYRMYVLFNGKLKPRLAAFLCILIIFILVAGFAVLFIVLFAGEAERGFSALLSRWSNLDITFVDFDIGSFINNIPILNQVIQFPESFDLTSIISDSLKMGAESIVTLISQGFTNISLSVVHFILILFICYFLYLEGPKLLKRINDLIPLGDSDTTELYDEIVNITRATALSTLVIGILEGIFGAILFVIFGLPSPIFWGFVMMLVSMIPLIGTNAVLVPAGVIMIISGRWLSGMLIIICGLTGISLSQYLLKPKLVGDRTGLHPALVLISILGGLIWLGLVGFLVGPMVASLFIVIWNQFGKRFREELTSKNLPRE